MLIEKVWLWLTWWAFQYLIPWSRKDKQNTYKASENHILCIFFMQRSLFVWKYIQFKSPQTEVSQKTEVLGNLISSRIMMTLFCQFLLEKVDLENYGLKRQIAWTFFIRLIKDITIWLSTPGLLNYLQSHVQRCPHNWLLESQVLLNLSQQCQICSYMRIHLWYPPCSLTMRFSR